MPGCLSLQLWLPVANKTLRFGDLRRGHFHRRGIAAFDGVGAGIFGVLAPLIVADLMRGTGRYNVSLGAVATVQGIGASLSNTVAGMVVVQAGYTVAFLTLAAVAAAAFATFLFAMPETGTPQGVEPGAGARPIKLPGARPAAAAPSLKLASIMEHRE